MTLTMKGVCLVLSTWCLVLVTGIGAIDVTSIDQNYDQGAHGDVIETQIDLDFGSSESDLLTTDYDRDLKSFLSDTIFERFKGRGDTTCTYKPTDFNATVVAHFLGNLDLTTSQELKKIGDAFSQTYNKLANGLCDEEFHKISFAIVSEKSLDESRQRSRELQASSRFRSFENNNVKATRRPLKMPKQKFSVMLAVIGNCNNCKANDELFDDAFRRLAPRQGLADFFKNKFQSGAPGRPIDEPALGVGFLRSKYNCDCLKNEELLHRRPGLEEFNDAFERKIASLVKRGELKFVQSLLGVAQLEEIQCDSLMKDFTSEIIVEAKGDPDSISTSELKILEDLFLESYGAASESVCDSQFRTVKDAKVTIETVSRRLISSSKHSSASKNGGSTGELDTRSAKRFRQIRMRVKVNGKCIDCKSKDKLFDDAFRRLMDGQFSELPFMKSMNRELGFILNGGDQCFCAKNSPKRTPSTGEFGYVYSVNVENSALPNVVSVGNVIQVDDSLPSQSPSQFPSTLMPSVSPTGVPSVSPSASPTERPTITESSTPSTSSPSRRPSSSPSNPTVPTESPMPSPQPSRTPSGL